MTYDQWKTTDPREYEPWEYDDDDRPEYIDEYIEWLSLVDLLDELENRYG